MNYKCPKCGNLVEEGTNPCPTCGQQFNWPKKDPEPVAPPVIPVVQPEPPVEQPIQQPVEQAIFTSEPAVEQPAVTNHPVVEQPTPSADETNPNKSNDDKKKKIILLCCLILLLIVIIFNLIKFGNFGGLNSDTDSNDNDTTATTVYSTTTTETTTEATVVSYNTWKKSNYTDEFGNVIGTYILGGVFKGTFNNSATTGSTLYVRVGIYDNDVVAFELYEYGKYIVKNHSSKYGIDYTIKIQDCDGIQYTLDGGICTSADEVSLIKSYNKTFINALQKGEVKVYLVNEDSPTDQYYFTVNKHNFDSVYDYNF